MKFSRRFILFAALAAAAALALLGLQPRLSAEKANKTVAFATEYSDINSLSLQSGLSADAVLAEIETLGVSCVAVDEFGGDELAAQTPMGIKYGSAGSLGIKRNGIGPERAVLQIAASSPYARPLCEYLSRKMPRIEILRSDMITIILPAAVDELSNCTFVPNFQVLDFCGHNKITAMFRPGPCTPSDGKETAAAFEWLFRCYPQIKNVTTTGMIMPGYPDLAPVAEILKKYRVSFSSVEFVKQIGLNEFAKAAFPYVLSLHSLTRDEIFSKKIDRRQMLERFVRAVHERSVRIIMMHPFDLQMGDKLRVFKEDLAAVRGGLSARGYVFGWPATLPVWPAPLAGAAACSLVLVFCGWFFCARLKGTEELTPGAAEAAVVLVAALAAVFIMFKIHFAYKLAGGFCGAFFAAEAALTALENYKKPWLGALGGLFIVLAGGLSLASFYGTTTAALRITPFSGVKLTLMLPPLMLLVHDLQRRIHPESMGEIIARPAYWGELAVIGAMMLALLIMVLRSDNVSNVPAAEVAFRDFMERLLLVRPRTKEFLVGYPALALYWYVAKRGWCVHYREALRIAAVLAFCSAADTFCHFHTLLVLSFVRVLNGWWVGMVCGAVAVAVLRFIVIPVWKKAQRCAA